MYEVKQVIVMRKDLNMRKGKMIAQGAHASMQFLITTNGLRCSPAENHWLATGAAKICVYVNSEAELMGIHTKALQAGLKSYVITDSGRTEFKGVPTNTCLAIGPDYNKKIDPITKDLKLL